ncbi:peptidase of plants and bacteria-domain-containing protein [Rostrohypoxylon terebratum]|nr:peptidase of plants and bacteria-domain-containing protein [Rostrohypoxylon terebratum]
MAAPAETTPVPPSTLAPGMTPRTDEPKLVKPTALPIRLKQDKSGSEEARHEEKQQKSVEIPRLRLHIEDLSHPGSAAFLSSVQAPAVLESGIRSIHKFLYGIPSSPSPSSPPFPTHPPKPRSITLFLRPKQGHIARTSTSDLDSEHKEINIVLSDYSSLSSWPLPERAREISGVLVHELVHFYQYDGNGSAP